MNPLKIPNDDKEWLVRRIADVKDKSCYMDILDLIHTGELDYTVNSNGVYFNLASVPDAEIDADDIHVAFWSWLHH